jgi:hypothetical protein
VNGLVYYRGRHLRSADAFTVVVIVVVVVVGVMVVMLKVVDYCKSVMDRVLCSHLGWLDDVEER